MTVMEKSKMQKHVTVVGSVQIGFSVLGLMGAVAIFVALTFARGFTEYDDVAQTVLEFLSISIPVLVGFLSTLGLAGQNSDVGCLSYKY